MVAWSDLSRCTNPDCPFKGSCRKFCPPAPPGSNAEHALLMALCVCGCYGVQHFEDSGKPPSTATQAADPGGQGTTNQRGDTDRPGSSIPAGSGSGGAFRSVSEAARDRKARMNAGLMDDIKTNVFDPSSKIHQNAWSKLSSRPEKRKKSTSSNEPPSKRKASTKADKAEADSQTVELTLVLVENNEELNAGEYTMPSTAKMRLLHSRGHIIPVRISRVASPSDVSRIVVETFSSIAAIESGRIDLILWRLLCIHSRGTGVPAILKPHTRATNLSLSDLEMASANHRQAKDFRKCVYIGLPPRFGESPSRLRY
ncbi:hypothetical protein C8R44DRAFT_810287 [Mycena epipterygia]|nr:hypothetical protein C8R44DRAFT_810287 [Mycena epipterygia]